LVGLKQGKLFNAVQISFSAIFSPGAWQLLREARRSRQSPNISDLIQKLVLVSD
jgi:hypothetical protein